MCKENTLIHYTDLSGITSKQVLDEISNGCISMQFQVTFLNYLGKVVK